MKTLTVKVPEELDLKLAAVAAKRGESKSNLIRTAIISILKENKAVIPNSCLDSDFKLYRKNGRQVIPSIIPG